MRITAVKIFDSHYNIRLAYPMAFADIQSIHLRLFNISILSVPGFPINDHPGSVVSSIDQVRYGVDSGIINVEGDGLLNVPDLNTGGCHYFSKAHRAQQVAEALLYLISCSDNLAPRNTIVVVELVEYPILLGG